MRNQLLGAIYALLFSMPSFGQFVIDKNYLKPSERCVGLATGMILQNVAGQNLKEGRYLSYIRISATLLDNDCSLASQDIDLDETDYRLLPVDLYIGHDGSVKVSVHVLEADGMDYNEGEFDGNIVGRIKAVGYEYDNSVPGVNYRGIVFLDFGLGFTVAQFANSDGGGVKVGFKAKVNFEPTTRLYVNEFNKQIHSEAQLNEEIDTFNNFLDTLENSSDPLNVNPFASLEGGAFVRISHITEKASFAVEASYTGLASYGTRKYQELAYRFNHIREGITIEAEYNRRLKKGSISFFLMVKPEFRNQVDLTPIHGERTGTGVISVLIPREFIKFGVRYTF
jgi:hypothetical protein